MVFIVFDKLHSLDCSKSLVFCSLTHITYLEYTFLIIEDPECLTTGGALTHSKLDTILDTVYPINTNLIPHETILTPDHGKTLYYNEVDEPLDAYRRMIEETTGEITTIWANYSPCPSCVRKLLDVFKEGDKPTIYFARVYKETETLSDIVTSLQCLGKLQHKGFSVVAWNFDTFKGDSVLTSECTSAITSAYTKENFTSALMELGRHVTFIQQLGDNTHASSWCEV